VRRKLDELTKSREAQLAAHDAAVADIKDALSAGPKDAVGSEEEVKPEPEVKVKRFVEFEREGADVFRIVFVCGKSRRTEGEGLVEKSKALKVGPSLDFAVREAGEALPSRVHAPIAIGVPRASVPAPFVVEFSTGVSESVAAAYSGVRGATTGFAFDVKKKTLTLTASVPNGVNARDEAEVLVIGPKCVEVGGFFGPLLRKAKVLDLRQIDPKKVKFAAHAFAGIEFDDVRVPMLARVDKFCEPFADAFEVRGYPFGLEIREGEDLKKALRGRKAKRMRTVRGVLRKLGEYAFWGAEQLVEVSLLDGLTEIGYRAFYGCSSLSSISIPTGCTSIDNCAFEGCSSLSSISIPTGCTSIGDWAF
jgi:hypothetical protein